MSSFACDNPWRLELSDGVRKFDRYNLHPSVVATFVTPTRNKTVYDIARMVGHNRHAGFENVQLELPFNFPVYKVKWVDDQSVEYWFAVKVLVFTSLADQHDALQRVQLLSDQSFTKEFSTVEYGVFIYDKTKLFWVETWIEWLDDVIVDMSTFMAVKDAGYAATCFAMKNKRAFTDIVSRNMGRTKDGKHVFFDYQEEGASLGTSRRCPARAIACFITRCKSLFTRL